MWFVALALATGCVWLALRLPPASAGHTINGGRMPRLWTLRLVGFVSTVAFFAAQWVLPTVNLAPFGVVGATIALATLIGWLVLRWSRRMNWGGQQRLALASGALGFFILLAPLLELHPPQNGKPYAGMTLAALALLVGLIWLARRVTFRPTCSHGD
jgi:hypothetical protein